MNRRPTCEEAAPREAARRRSRPDRAADRHAVDRLRGDPPRRAVADGVLAGRARRRRLPRARPARGAAAGGVDGDGARRRRTSTRPPAAAAAPPAACVVKQRDGRPIKIEGNDASPLTGGGTCAAGQASVLSLYDDARLRGPLWLGNPVSWPEIDRHIRDGAGRAAAAIRATSCCCRRRSPARRRARCSTSCARRFPKFRHVVYDPMSLAALREANRRCLRRGRGAALPLRPGARRRRARGRLPRDLAVAGRVRAPVRAAAAARTRRPRVPRAVRIRRVGHGQQRRPAPRRRAVGARRGRGRRCWPRVGRRVGDAGLVGRRVAGLGRAAPHAAAIERVAEALVRTAANRWSSSGSDDVAAQIVVAKLNALLGNIGATVDLERPSLQRQGDDAAMAALIDDMNARRGARAAPLGRRTRSTTTRTAPRSAPALAEGARCRSRSPIAATRPAPTSTRSARITTSWRRGATPSRSAGTSACAQPLIAPLYDTRAADESLLTWAGRPTDHRAYLRAFWQRELYPRAGAAAATSTRFWERALERGVVDLPRAAGGDACVRGRPGGGRPRHRVARQPRAAADDDDAGYELRAARDRRRARRPPRQQPVAAGAARSDDAADLGQRRVAWRPRPPRRWASRRRRRRADDRDAASWSCRSFVQPGQQRAHDLGRASATGARAAGKAGDGVGGNVFPLARVDERRAPLLGAASTIAKTGRRAPLAPAQTHFSMEGRAIVQTIDARRELASHAAGERGAREAARPLARAAARRARLGDVDRSRRLHRLLGLRRRLPGREQRPGRRRRAGAQEPRSCTGCASTVTTRATARTRPTPSTSR